MHTSYHTVVLIGELIQCYLKLEHKKDAVPQKTRLWMKIYEAAISNYVAQHMCVGGLCLVGSLTNSILHKIQGRDLMQSWKLRHPGMVH